jgi:hypothetical protein
MVSRTRSGVELVRIGPSVYGLWLVVPAAVQTTGWFHTNRIGLSPAAVAGMQLGVQMLASFNGAVRMPTTTQDQTLCSRLQSTQPAN